MRSILLQHNNYHYECIGIGIQYILNNSTDCSGIDIYISHGNDPFGVEWITYMKNAFPSIDIQQIKCFTNIQYDIYFLVSAFERNHLYEVFYKRLSKKPKRLAGIVHDMRGHYPEFQTLALTPCVKRPLAALPKYREMLCDLFPNDFHPELGVFSTGNPNNLDTLGIIRYLEKNDLRLLFLSREKNLGVSSKIVFYKQTAVANLIKCFLYKKGFLFPKGGSPYEKERVSGMIHLAYSFDTPLFVPLKIAELFPDHSNLIGFNNYDEITSFFCGW